MDKYFWFKAAGAAAFASAWVWPLCCIAQAAAKTGPPEWSVMAAVGTTHYTSNERNAQGSVINREQGSLPHIEMGLRWSLRDAFAQLSLQRAAHDIRYQGVTQAGFALDTRTDLDIDQWQLLGGWRSVLTQQQTLEFTAGLQQRRIDRFIRPTAGSLALQETLYSSNAVLGAAWLVNGIKLWQMPVHLRVAGQWQPSFRQRLDINSLGVLDPVSVTPAQASDWALALRGQVDVSARWSASLGWTYQAIRPGASNSTAWLKNGVPVATVRYPGSRQSTATWQLGVQGQF